MGARETRADRVGTEGVRRLKDSYLEQVLCLLLAFTDPRSVGNGWGKFAWVVDFCGNHLLLLSSFAFTYRWAK